MEQHCDCLRQFTNELCYVHVCVRVYRLMQDFFNIRIFSLRILKVLMLEYAYTIRSFVEHNRNEPHTINSNMDISDVTCYGLFISRYECTSRNITLFFLYHIK